MNSCWTLPIHRLWPEESPPREALLADAVRPAWAYTPEYLHFRLAEEMARSRLSRTALAVMIIQLRRADVTKWAVAEILRGVRSADIAVITGQYEIAICLLDVDRYEAQAAGKRLLSNLGEVASGMGLAVYPVDPIDDPIDLVDLARKRSTGKA